jgi:hypothetical protein
MASHAVPKAFPAMPSNRTRYPSSSFTLFGPSWDSLPNLGQTCSNFYTRDSAWLESSLKEPFHKTNALPNLPSSDPESQPPKFAELDWCSTSPSLTIEI